MFFFIHFLCKNNEFEFESKSQLSAQYSRRLRCSTDRNLIFNWFSSWTPCIRNHNIFLLSTVAVLFFAFVSRLKWKREVSTENSQDSCNNEEMQAHTFYFAVFFIIYLFIRRFIQLFLLRFHRVVFFPSTLRMLYVRPAMWCVLLFVSRRQRARCANWKIGLRIIFVCQGAPFFFLNLKCSVNGIWYIQYHQHHQREKKRADLEH